MSNKLYNLCLSYKYEEFYSLVLDGDYELPELWYTQKKIGLPTVMPLLYLMNSKNNFCYLKFNLFKRLVKLHYSEFPEKVKKIIFDRLIREKDYRYHELLFLTDEKTYKSNLIYYGYCLKHSDKYENYCTKKFIQDNNLFITGEEFLKYGKDINDVSVHFVSSILDISVNENQYDYMASLANKYKKGSIIFKKMIKREILNENDDEFEFLDGISYF